MKTEAETFANFSEICGPFRGGEVALMLRLGACLLSVPFLSLSISEQEMDHSGSIYGGLQEGGSRMKRAICLFASLSTSPPNQNCLSHPILSWLASRRQLVGFWGKQDAGLWPAPAGFCIGNKMDWMRHIELMLCVFLTKFMVFQCHQTVRSYFMASAEECSKTS